MARATWDDREQPILEAIADLEPTHPQLNNDDLAAATGIDRESLDRALLALVEADYITGTNAAAEELCYLIGARLLERGRRAVGQWPAEDSAEALLELVSARVTSAASVEERNRWEKFLDAARGLSGKALQEVTIAFLKHQAGL
jgi:DNA-binding IclR family transcriptional regulator